MSEHSYNIRLYKLEHITSLYLDLPLCENLLYGRASATIGPR